MWDTAEGHLGPALGRGPVGTGLLSHDRPCPRCGHALHTFLACSDSCDCVPLATSARR